jgi:hypothetical protein
MQSRIYPPAFIMAVQTNRLDVVKMFFLPRIDEPTDHVKNVGLYVAAKAGHDEIGLFLLEHHAPDSPWCTLAQEFALTGSAKLLEALISRREVGNVKCRREMKDQLTGILWGGSWVPGALVQSSPEVLDILVRAGASLAPSHRPFHFRSDSLAVKRLRGRHAGLMNLSLYPLMKPQDADVYVSMAIRLLEHKIKQGMISHSENWVLLTKTLRSVLSASVPLVEFFYPSRAHLLISDDCDVPDMATLRETLVRGAVELPNENLETMHGPAASDAVLHYLLSHGCILSEQHFRLAIFYGHRAAIDLCLGAGMSVNKPLPTPCVDTYTPPPQPLPEQLSWGRPRAKPSRYARVTPLEYALIAYVTSSNTSGFGKYRYLRSAAQLISCGADYSNLGEWICRRLFEFPIRSRLNTLCSRP